MRFLMHVLMSFALVTPVEVWACPDQPKVSSVHHHLKAAPGHVVAQQKKATHAIKLAVAHIKSKERYKLVTYYSHGKKRHKYVDTHKTEIAKKAVKKQEGQITETPAPTDDSNLVAHGYLPGDPEVQQRSVSSVAAVNPAETPTLQTVDSDDDVHPPSILQ